LRSARSEVLYANRFAAHWVHRASSASRLFQSAGERHSRSAVPPVRLKTELILPHATPLQSPFTQFPRRSSFDARLHLPLGFRPSSRHHSSAATIPRGTSHAPLRSVLRFSQPLDGFFRSRACRLISSRSHVQGQTFVQGLLSRRSHPSSSEGASSMPLLHRRSYTRSDFHRLVCRPRAMPLDFEASICAGPRSSSPVIRLAQSRSPLRISRSSRSSLSRRRPPLSRLPSALDVTRSPFTSACILRCTRSRSSARYRFSMFAAANHRGGLRAVLFRVALQPTSVLSDRFGIPRLTRGIF